MISLSQEEKKAIVAIAVGMAGADGRVVNVESLAMIQESLRMGINIESALNTMMNPETAIQVASKMLLEKKKYLYSILLKIMAADAYAHPSELAFLNYIKKEVNLPELTRNEAESYLNSL